METTREIYRSPIVVVATGMNNVPNPEQLPDQSAFEGTVIHSAEGPIPLALLPVGVPLAAAVPHHDAAGRLAMQDFPYGGRRPPARPPLRRSAILDSNCA